MVCVFIFSPSLLNPTQVGVSLQVFYNLGQLSPLQHESQTALDLTILTQGLEGEECVGCGM